MPVRLSMLGAAEAPSAKMAAASMFVSCMLIDAGDCWLFVEDRCSEGDVIVDCDEKR